MSTSFGQWYDEQKSGESGESSSSWFGSDQLLPLFDTESMQNFSFANMKSAMEAQMPKKIMGMGYQQRFQVFCGLLFLSGVFFALAFFVGIPTMAVHPHKFSLSFSMGSLMFMSSFGILKGPMEHIQSMFQADRMLFTSIYLGSLFFTLFCTFSYGGISGYFMVMLSSGIQLMALLWYLISFLPGGTAGLKYVFAAMGHIMKPVFMACARFQAMCMGRCLSWITSGGS